MLLQLTQGLRQWEFGTAMTGRRSARAPHPHVEASAQPAFVQRYIACTWRGERMSLLEYLRKSGSRGQIAGWLRQRHSEETEGGAEVELEDFARALTVRGEQVAAVDYLWRLNDRYFGQWCMMHLPFRSLDVFQTVPGVDKVPNRYRWFATALLLTDTVEGPLRGFWRDLERLVQDMQLEGRSDAIIRDTRLFIEALTVAVDAYVAGRVDQAEETAQADGPLGQTSLGNDADLIKFEDQQLLFFNAIQTRVARSLAAQRATDDAVLDEALSRLRDLSNRPLVCSGKPGTGKTTVALDCARRALSDGAEVLIASPTARMASRTRQRLGEHEGLVVETFAAAFQLHVPEPEASYVLCGYTLVIVDEYSQLGQADFERILRLWGMADRVPALVFLGDKYQLPGVDPQRPWESAAWKSCQTMELVKIHRSRDPAFLDFGSASVQYANESSSTTSVEAENLGLAMRRLRRTWHGSCASIRTPPTWQPPDAGLRRSTAWPFKGCTRVPRRWLTCLARMRTTPTTTLQGVCAQIAVRVRRRCPSTRARDCI